MIKRESGVLTCMSKGMNGLPRENTVGGTRLMQEIDERLAEKMKNKSDKGMEI